MTFAAKTHKLDRSSKLATVHTAPKRPAITARSVVFLHPAPLEPTSAADSPHDEPERLHSPFVRFIA